MGMGTATLDRPSVDGPAPTRAAQLAEVAAETAEWIAADLERRQATGAGNYTAAAARIRRRAAKYRAEARQLRAN